MTDQREGWIKALVKGSIVAVKRFSLGNNCNVMSLIEVTKVTQTGQIIAGGVRFNPQGSEMTGDLWKKKRYLVSNEEFAEWNNENKKKFDRFNIEKKLEDVLSAKEKLTDDQINRIIAITEEVA